MKHKLFFSGKTIDLSQQQKGIESDIKSSLATFYPVEFVQLDSYTENGNTCKIVVNRSYNSSYSSAMGPNFINFHDMSLISGLDKSGFEPWNDDHLPLHLIPWYDNFVYAPNDDFYNIFKQLNEKMLGKKEIKKIETMALNGQLIINVTFK